MEWLFWSEVCITDGLEVSQPRLRYHLVLWGDRFLFFAARTTFSVKIRLEMVIVISNYSVFLRFGPIVTLIKTIMGDSSLILVDT